MATTQTRTVLVSLLAAFALGASSCAGDPAGPATLIEFPTARPGDVVGIVAVDASDGTRTVEWVDRLNGTIMRLDIDDDSAVPETVTTIDIGTDGEQRGLLGHVVIDGRRFAAWTQPVTFELVVGEVLDDGLTRIVWSAGNAGGGAIGGVLHSTSDGTLLLGLGRNTDWDAATRVGGAILEIDPDGDPEQEERVISTGYTNPWAYTSLADSSIWVADNAAGPDPDDESRDDVERIGRADLEADRNEMAEVEWTQRAPAAMVELPDGRVGICGFLDNELRAYEVVETSDPQRPTLERAGTIMACNTGAAVFADGTIVTAAQTDTAESLQILRP